MLLADACAAAGMETRLLLGPTHLLPARADVAIERFNATADLDALLREHQAKCDVLVMAAAVADYRPNIGQLPVSGKLRRTEQSLTIKLEPTPDLLAGCHLRRREGQTLIGFALEPRETMLESARAKLVRKGIDAIVANPLETMESPDIEATLLLADGETIETPGKMTKSAFAEWLVAAIKEVHGASRSTSTSR